MKIELKKRICVVTREEGDLKYYGIRNAAGESRLLYAIKNRLIEMGHDVIKKRMHKDGHMVDDLQQYIRTRKGFEPSFCMWNSTWSVCGLEEGWNQRGHVALSIVWDIWEKNE